MLWDITIFEFQLSTIFRTAGVRGGGAHVPCYTVYVPKNLTLTIDEDLLRAARKVALDRNTSVNQMVREYLTGVVRDTGRQRAAVAKFEELIRTTQGRVGGATWTRDELHER